MVCLVEALNGRLWEDESLKLWTGERERMVMIWERSGPMRRAPRSGPMRRAPGQSGPMRRAPSTRAESQSFPKPIYIPNSYPTLTSLTLIQGIVSRLLYCLWKSSQHEPSLHSGTWQVLHPYQVLLGRWTCLEFPSCSPKTRRIFSFFLHPIHSPCLPGSKWEPCWTIGFSLGLRVPGSVGSGTVAMLEDDLFLEVDRWNYWKRGNIYIVDNCKHRDSKGFSLVRH